MVAIRLRPRSGQWRGVFLSVGTRLNVGERAHDVGIPRNRRPPDQRQLRWTCFIAARSSDSSEHLFNGRQRADVIASITLTQQMWLRRTNERTSEWQRPAYCPSTATSTTSTTCPPAGRRPLPSHPTVSIVIEIRSEIL